MSKYQITTQRELRRAFWNSDGDQLFRSVHKRGRRHGWTQNDYPADIRMAWCNYVDACARDGIISEQLAARATL